MSQHTFTIIYGSYFFPGDFVLAFKVYLENFQASFHINLEND